MTFNPSHVPLPVLHAVQCSAYRPCMCSCCHVTGRKKAYAYYAQILRYLADACLHKQWLQCINYIILLCNGDQNTHVHVHTRYKHTKNLPQKQTHNININQTSRTQQVFVKNKHYVRGLFQRLTVATLSGVPIAHTKPCI